MRELSEIGIESLYHKFTNEVQGEETKPTFYLQRKIEKPYHIDFCFAPKRLSDKLINLGSLINSLTKPRAPISESINFLNSLEKWVKKIRSLSSASQSSTKLNLFALYIKI